MRILPNTPWLASPRRKDENGIEFGLIMVDQSLSHPANKGLNGFARNDVSLLKEAAAANDLKTQELILARFRDLGGSSTANLTDAQLAERFIPSSVQSYAEMERYARNYAERVTNRLYNESLARSKADGVRNIDVSKVINDDSTHNESVDVK